MIYFLAIAFPVLLVGSGIYCLFFCQACERRRAERQIEMQLQAGREVNALLRAQRAIAKAEELAKEIEVIVVRDVAKR